MQDNTEIIKWIVGAGITTIVSLFISIITAIKSAKMMSRDLKAADLENKKTEISIADQYDMLATRASERTAKIQERLDKIENENQGIQSQLREQKETITNQAIIIQEQSLRLDLQDKKILDQEEEISKLKCELENTKRYNSALIEQMKEQNIIPIDVSSVITKDCSKIKRRKPSPKNYPENDGEETENNRE